MCRRSQALYSRKQRFVRSGRCKLLKQLSRDPEYLAHSRYRLNSSHFRKALCCCRARVSGTLSSSARCWSTTSDWKPYRMVLDTGSRRTLVGNPVVPASENADIGRPSRRGDRNRSCNDWRRPGCRPKPRRWCSYKRGGRRRNGAPIQKVLPTLKLVFFEAGSIQSTSMPRCSYRRESHSTCSIN